MTPLVSIVIPVYNGADFLREAIDSALAQTWPNVEVLVVNDGSTDGGATEAIAKSYGGRIRYFSKPNGHVASALNFGIRQMAGPYFSWLSHDDLYKPGKIAAQMEALGRLGGDTVVYGDFEILEQASGALTPVRLPDVPSAHFRHYITLNSAIHGCTLLVPKRCLDACGQFDESLRTTQDYDLWFRIAGRFRFVHLPGIVVTSRHHAAQGTNALRDVAAIECDRLRVGFVRALTDGEVAAAAGTSAPRAYLGMAARLQGLGFSEARSAALERARAAAGHRSRLARFALEAEAALAFWARPHLARLRRWIG